MSIAYRDQWWYRLSVRGEAVSLDGSAPERVVLFPRINPHEPINTTDGRIWYIDDPVAIVDASNIGVDLPIDWEHSQMRKAPSGEMARAAGWITALLVEDGAIVAEIEWTETGRESVEAKEYRYISPEFMHDKSGLIKSIHGASLVNKPAIVQPALAGRESGETDGEVITALAARVQSLESELKSTREAATEAEIDTELDAAQASGLIVPADREYHKSAIAAKASGLSDFRRYCASMRRLNPDGFLAPSGVSAAPPATAGEGGGPQAQVARLLGRSREWIRSKQ